MLDALADRYRREHGDGGLVQMEQDGATYLLDLAQTAGLSREGPDVAARTLEREAAVPGTFFIGHLL